MQVDYACTPEEVQQRFQSCGTVNRVTILTDKIGQPKGFAYVEFVEVEAVQNAVLSNESELHRRQLKVSAKRTNVPGLKQYGERYPALTQGLDLGGLSCQRHLFILLMDMGGIQGIGGPWVQALLIRKCCSEFGFLAGSSRLSSHFSYMNCRITDFMNSYISVYFYSLILLFLCY